MQKVILLCKILIETLPTLPKGFVNFPFLCFLFLWIITEVLFVKFVSSLSFIQVFGGNWELYSCVWVCVVYTPCSIYIMGPVCVGGWKNDLIHCQSSKWCYLSHKIWYFPSCFVPLLPLTDSNRERSFLLLFSFLIITICIIRILQMKILFSFLFRFDFHCNS